MKKVLCLLLALLIVVPLATACGGDDTDTSKTESTASSDTSKTQSTTPSQDDGDDSVLTYYKRTELPVVDMDGREFYIIQRWFGYGKPTIDFTGEVLYTADSNGELSSVNKKKQEIITDVQTKYNCTITGELFCEGEPLAAALRTKIEEDITSGTYKYDFFFETYYYYNAFVTNNYLADFYSEELKYIELTDSCWDQNGVKELSIAGSLYYALGDINTYDNDGTFVVLFNKTMYEELGKGNPDDLYQMVKDGEWTFDKLVELTKDVTTESDGVDGLSEKDTWGFGSETHNLYLHVLAAGEKIVSKDKNDIPKLTMTTKTTYDALQKAVEFYTSGTVLVADNGSFDGKYADIYEGTVTNAFLEGRELFYMCGLLHVPYFRNMDEGTEFGILPVPKYSEEQDRYYSGVQVHTMSVLMIPYTPNVDENLGIIIQALAHASEDTLTPEYYEKQLKYRDTRDDGAAEMLDIIFEQRVFDLGTAMGKAWGECVELYTVLDTNIESRFKAQVDTITANIEDTVEKIQKNQKENAA